MKMNEWMNECMDEWMNENRENKQSWCSATLHKQNVS